MQGRLWCIRGDFNATKKARERKGYKSQSNATKMAEFSDFISAMELMDLPATRNKFIWFNTQGSFMSRINRFLIFKDLSELWGLEGLALGNQEIYDHAPILPKVKFFN